MSKDGKRSDYVVGYGKPPERTRFPQGRSGNPKGRPPKPKSPQTVSSGTPSEELFLKLMRQQIPVLDKGEAKQVSMLEAVLRGLAVAGGKGNTRAAKILLDHTLAIEKRQAESEHEAVALTQENADARDNVVRDLLEILLHCSLLRPLCSHATRPRDPPLQRGGCGDGIVDRPELADVLVEQLQTLITL